MNTVVKRSDSLKWLAVFAIFAASIVANYHYDGVAWALRAALGILLVAIIVGIALSTAKGWQAWEFIKSARIELRKVVWPTRQETVQTTLVVVVFVVITALILWGLDSLFLWLIGLLLGQRG